MLFKYRDDFPAIGYNTPLNTVKGYLTRAYVNIDKLKELKDKPNLLEAFTILEYGSGNELLKQYLSTGLLSFARPDILLPVEFVHVGYYEFSQIMDLHLNPDCSRAWVRMIKKLYNEGSLGRRIRLLKHSIKKVIHNIVWR